MQISKTLIAAGLVSLVVASPVEVDKRASRFQFFGVSQSGAEFGEKNLPGVKGTDYTWPDANKIQTLVNDGFNTFRVAFKMERLTPSGLNGAFAAEYLNDMKTTVNAITSKGAYAVLDPHNYGRWKDVIITDTNAFKSWWQKLATEFKSNSRVIFDTNNEFHEMDQTLVLNLNQAAINGIRASGATSQAIFIEGNSWTGAWTFPSVNDNLKNLKDPNNNIYYEMHQYLDADGSGTSPTCVSNTIGQERVTAATNWLRTNGKKGIIGEFAGGPNTQCKTAITGMLNYMAQNTDVWKGALWWAAGPWWADYMYSMEPGTGPAYNYYISTLKTLYKRTADLVTGN